MRAEVDTACIDDSINQSIGAAWDPGKAPSKVCYF